MQEVDDQLTPDVSDGHTGLSLDAASLNINKFLLETPDNQAQSSTSRTVASLNINKFLLETPDNQAISSTSRSSEKNDGSSGRNAVNKKRDIIDLDDLPDEDEAVGSSKKPLLASVKIEQSE